MFRRWWPTLALIALGSASVILLYGTHVRGRQVLQQTVASLDNVSESRRRLLHAYLIHERRLADDATFSQASPLAELRAAEYALRNWTAGRSGIIDFRGTVPGDSALLSPRRSYEEALGRLRTLLMSDPGNAVALRQRFSEADRAAAALEAAIRVAVRDAVQSQERAFRLRLAGWALLLIASVVGATYARRALRASESHRAETESRLSRLREVAPVGIAESDEAGRIVAVNRMWSSLTGRPEQDWLGVEWWRALDERDQERGRSVWTAASTNPEHTAEARLAHRRTSDGDPTWVLIHPGRASGGAASGVRRVVTLTDITEQRAVEEQLHHAQRMEAVGRLAGGVAHDFNNLLTGIGGFAQLALEQVQNDDSLESDLQEIKRSADRGRALTRQLLTFSRQDRPDPRVVDARDVVRHLERMLSQLVGDNVEIETDLVDTPAPILADPNQVEQVVTNLVINASDAMAGRGQIRIAVQTTRVEEVFRGARSDIQPGEYVLLSISDTGPGIPPEVRDRIFEPFFTTKEHGKGTGLGLSTVWGIVRQTGGHIHVYSESGQGTVFKIYLPAEAGAVMPDAQAAGAAPPIPTTGTALVVEDEDAVRRLITRVLEMRGWTVVDVASGDEALRRLDEWQGRIDLIITDLMMRGVGGAELVERLRQRGVEVPTLFVSGWADSEVDLEGAAFLEKPFTPAALVRSVAAVVERGA